MCTQCLSLNKPALVRNETKGWEGGRKVDNLKVDLKGFAGE